MRNPGRERGTFGRIDRWTVILYASLVFLGWINIYAAVYNEAHSNIFDTTQQYGKQLIWIVTSIVIIFAILMSDARLYENIAYPVYGATIILLILVLIIGKEVAGNQSWIQIGSFSLQPSEFAKFGTALAMARYMSTLNVDIKRVRHRLWPLLFMALPFLLIIAQPDVGSAIVFASFILVLYREGLPGVYLFTGFLAIAIVIVSLVFSTEWVITSIAVLTVIAIWLVHKSWRAILVTSLIAVFSAGLSYITETVFNEALQPHQQSRINVLLGLEDDPSGVGYHTMQSLIAIGSGGMTGKGFLQGTQTKFDFVPEQSTDYIFCTVGEEWGFIGSTLVVLLFVALIARLIHLSERQKSNFARIYGYSLVSVLFIHFAINIAMTLGLAPVIGIPLPFFSYGGSSLWGFTILLFIFVRLDANRWQML